MSLKILHCVLVAAGLLFTVSACREGGQSDSDDGPWPEPELDCPHPDIPGCPDDWSQPCSPVTQAGCEAGEKCAQLVEIAPTEANPDLPFLAKTTCVPDGVIAEGGVCASGEAGVATGFDNCVAGFHCTDGVCTEICDVGPPDGCRAETEAFGEGSYCTVYEDLFTDDIGVCEPGCHPTDDRVTGDLVSNASCDEGEGCYLNPERGIASCVPTYVGATAKTQNEDCQNAWNVCPLNGCASGFSPLLPNSSEGPDATHCARYCSPAETHADAQDNSLGLSGNCSLEAMKAIGSTNGVQREHQCRFVQTFSHEAKLVDASVGMCVPIIPTIGGTWSDCTEFFWEDIKTVWSDALAGGADPRVAFDEFCLEDPNNPENSSLRVGCVGLERGCVSSLEIELGLPGFGIGP